MKVYRVSRRGERGVLRRRRRRRRIWPLLQPLRMQTPPQGKCYL
jgi:hypothetical protein